MLCSVVASQPRPNHNGLKSLKLFFRPDFQDEVRARWWRGHAESKQLPLCIHTTSIIHRVRLLERREMSALRNYGQARARNAEDNLLGERWRCSTAVFTPA